jgi:hypothetical protein
MIIKIGGLIMIILIICNPGSQVDVDGKDDEYLKWVGASKRGACLSSGG